MILFFLGTKTKKEKIPRKKERKEQKKEIRNIREKFSIPKEIFYLRSKC